MTTKVIERVPLEERLKRLEAGFASSVQASQAIVDQFCQTPVVPVLKAINEVATCRVLQKHKRLLMTYRVTPENVTFGDLSRAIANCDRQLHSSPTASSPAMYDDTQQLLAVYFLPLEHIRLKSCYAAERQKPFLRDSLPPELGPVYDFFYVCFKDYLSYGRKAGLDYPTHQRILRYLKELNDVGADDKYPLWLYDGIKAAYPNLEESFSSMEQDKLPPLAQCKYFLAMFVYPVSSIAASL